MTFQTYWWQTGVIYQIWVRSFYDSNGDGIGDLAGIVEKLDYIQALGADAIWLSPIFPSPWADAGYDVSDFCNVHPQLGGLADVDRLVSESHQRNIRVILDWLVNHTSDRHPWFEDARSRRGSKYRDWYVWADPKSDGSPPNNWLGVFGGSAWTLDEATGQYYFHAFLPEQPDLNWRNPQVVEAMHDNLRFWLQRGIDGFRLDALDMLLEHPELPDNPPNPDFDPSGPLDMKVFQKYTRNQLGIHELVAGMRKVCDEFESRVLLGEMYVGPDQMVSYYGTPELPELHLPLNPQFLRQRWDADEMAKAIGHYLDAVSAYGWPTWALSNHDINRLTQRAQSEQPRVAAMLLLTLRGTPSIYYGDEIGMHDVEVPRDLIEDPQGKAQPHRARDVARTPMQWNDGLNAGFTTGSPYFPIAGDYRQINVAAQEQDPRSLLALYRRLLALRKTEPALARGIQTPVVRRAPLLVYRRELPERRLLVILNMAGDDLTFDFSELASSATMLVSTFLDSHNKLVEDEIAIRGNEGVVLALGQQ
jgi:alpha-glucosidase